MGLAEAMRKFENTEIVLASSYSKKMTLDEAKRHLSPGKNKLTKGWILAVDLSSLLKEGLIPKDKEVYILVFGDSKLRDTVTSMDAQLSRALDSRAVSEISLE